MPRTEHLLLAGSTSQGLLPPALAAAMCRALPTGEKRERERNRRDEKFRFRSRFLLNERGSNCFLLFPLSLSLSLSLSLLCSLLCSLLPSFAVESALIDGLADFHLPGDDTENFEASDLAVGALLAAVASTCAPRLALGSELLLRQGASSASASSSSLAPLPTGIPEIDALLRPRAGLPRGGLLTEVYGGPSSGKTQLALAAAATAAASRGRVLWLDACSGGGGGEGGGGRNGGTEWASPFPARRLATLVAAAAGLAPPPLPLPPASPSSSSAPGFSLPAALEAALERVVVVPVSRISEAAAALDLAVVAAGRARQERGGRRGGPSRSPPASSFDLIILDSAASLFGPVLGGGGGGASGSSGAGHAAMVSFVRSLKAAAAALGAAALVTNHERSPSRALLASASRSSASPVPPPNPALGEAWRPQATLRLRLAVPRGDNPLAGGGGAGRGVGGASASARTAQLVKGGAGGAWSAPTRWALPLSGGGGER